MAAFQKSHRRLRHQKPRQLGHFGHVGLHEQRGLLGIKAQRQQIQRGVQRVSGQRFPVPHRRQGVQVGDEVKRRLVAVLQRDVLPDRAKIIAPVKAARRLNAG